MLCHSDEIERRLWLADFYFGSILVPSQQLRWRNRPVCGLFDPSHFHVTDLEALPLLRSNASRPTFPMWWCWQPRPHRVRWRAVDGDVSAECQHLSIG